MEEWYSKNYIININEERNEEIVQDSKGQDFQTQISQEINDEIYSDKYSRPSKTLVDIDLYKKNILLRDRTNDVSLFEKWFKIVNPYEKVLKLSKYNKEKDPTFLKLIEILVFIDYFSKEKIEEKWYLINNNNSILDNCLSYLSSDNSYEKEVIEVKDMVSIENLLNIEKKYSLVFSDIFIDMSFDYNNQEQLYFKYFLYSVINAIKLNTNEGTFICKIYDTITKPTVQLITILKSIYNKVLLIKPRMSYCSSSEKYIVCSGFRYSELIMNRLIKIYNGIKGNFCRDLFVLFPEELFLNKYSSITDKINDYNNRLIKNEINLLENVINTSTQSYIYTKLLESYQQKISSEFVDVFGMSKRDFESNVGDCRHFTKNLSSVNRCEKCFKYWV